jgi:hypothetical protein
MQCSECNKDINIEDMIIFDRDENMCGECFEKLMTEEQSANEDYAGKDI